MCQEVFILLLFSVLFCPLPFFHSFFLALDSGKCFFVSLALWYISVSQQDGLPVSRSPPLTVISTPWPSHLHSGWITERPVRGHGLIVQPKNSPWLSLLWPFHPRSFIGPLQHFLSCVARVLGCVEMTLILTRTQKRENITARRALELKEGWLKS